MGDATINPGGLPRTGPRPSGNLGGNALGALSMAVWAAGFPAADILLRTLDPVTAVAGRALFAALPLILLWAVIERQGWRRPGAALGLVIGGIGFGGGALTVILAQWHTDPVTVAIIAAASPLTATLVEWLAERRPLTRPFLIGLVLTLIGGAIATGIFSGVALPEGLGLGAFYALVSCTLFSWASYRTNRDLPDHSVLGRATVTTCGAALFLLAIWAAGFIGGGIALPEGGIGLSHVGLLVIYGTGAMALSQLLWIAAVQRLGVSMASFHINIAPFYVMILMLALGGSWSWAQFLGAMIVALGVVLAQRR